MATMTSPRAVEPGGEGRRLAVVPTQVDADDPWVGLAQLLQDAGVALLLPSSTKTASHVSFRGSNDSAIRRWSSLRLDSSLCSGTTTETSGGSTPLGSSVRRGSFAPAGGLECVGHPSAELRRRAGARGEPARRAWPRLRELPAHPRRGPHRDRRAVDRRGAGMRRRERQVRQGAEAFGQPIGRYQSIAFTLARMEARAHAARTAYFDAAALMLAGKPFKKQAASPSWSPARRPWTTPATRPRFTAATVS